MKKVTFLLAILFATAVAVSSCNKKACPAYSNADHQTEQVV
jgi:hypothetical protein